MQISRGIAGLHCPAGIPDKHASVAVSPLSGLGSTRPGLGKLVTTDKRELHSSLSFSPQTPLSSLPAYLQPKYRPKMQQPQQIPQGWEARW
jgi:hypothetical protein